MTVLVLAISATGVTAIMLTGSAKTEKENAEPDYTEEASEEASGGILSENVSAAPGCCALDYSYLKGTVYKNLNATRYTNLLETMKPDEPVVEAATVSGSGGGGGGYSQVGVGSAANPGYSGSVGTYSLNSKTVAAHLTVQGTSVQDRAVWQCTGDTNYYTNGSVTWAAGSANLRSGELSQNTVIYGHNWNNCFAPFKRTGGEFESLMAFVYEDFVEENQYIYLTTNGGTHTFRVFAVCFTKDLSFYINCNNIDVSSVADKAKGMSLYDFGVSVSDSDKIITLSTCTRYYKGLGANQRFIIMGKLISTE